jgi:hypothetical protein
VNDLDLFGMSASISIWVRTRDGVEMVALHHRVDPRCLSYSVDSHGPSRVSIDHVEDCNCGVPEIAKVEPEPPPSITCPTCQRTSYNPNDIEQKFCGVCGYHDGSLTK